MLAKLKEYAPVLACVLMGLGLLFKPGDLFDGLVAEWPTVAPWLPVIGALLLAYFGAATSIRWMADVWNAVHTKVERKKEQVLASIDDMSSNLPGGMHNWHGNPENRSALAKADVIAKDLIAWGLLDERISERHDAGFNQAYLARLRKNVSRHGVRYARKNRKAIFEREVSLWKS